MSTAPNAAALTKDHPFDVFKSPSPSYKYKIGLRGSRTLSVPDSTERSLMNFQPTAKRALSIADEQNLRITVHKRLSQSGAKLIERIYAPRQD